MRRRRSLIRGLSVFPSVGLLTLGWGVTGCTGQHASSDLAPRCQSPSCPLPSGVEVSVSSIQRGARPLDSTNVLPTGEFYVLLDLNMKVHHDYETASGFISVTPAGATPSIPTAQVGYNGTFPTTKPCVIPPPPGHANAGSMAGPVPRLHKGERFGPVSVCVIVHGRSSEPLTMTWWITLLQPDPPYPNDFLPYQRSIPLT